MTTSMPSKRSSYLNQINFFSKFQKEKTHDCLNVSLKVSRGSSLVEVSPSASDVNGSHSVSLGSSPMQSPTNSTGSIPTFGDSFMQPVSVDVTDVTNTDGTSTITNAATNTITNTVPIKVPTKTLPTSPPSVSPATPPTDAHVHAPLSIQIDKSIVTLIKPKSKPTLLYRLFHSEDEDVKPCLMDSESSDTNSSLCPKVPEPKRKSHLNLMDFFKKESPVAVAAEGPHKKELPFLFRHLKGIKGHASSTSVTGTTNVTNGHTSNTNATGTTNGHTSTTTDQLPYRQAGTPPGKSLVPPVLPLRTYSEGSLCEKYGWIEKGCVGRGANGVVRVSHKTDPNSPNKEKLYAIKEFRKRNKNETEKSYIKKLTSEFCIGSALHHENVIETVDLVQNEQHQWCEVLEYCGGGDLCNLIQNKHLNVDEANIYFIQLIHGVSYIHSMGVAHRDLKPENLMLDAKGCLKITDFGEAEVFQTPYEQSPHKSKRCCGSQPYMAPEEFTEKEFDPRPIDIFACGIIYLAMIYNRLPWKKPHLEDPNYRYYVDHSGLGMIDRLPHGPRELMKRILCPDPFKRPSMQDILKDEWFQQVEKMIELQKLINEATQGGTCTTSLGSVNGGTCVTSLGTVNGGTCTTSIASLNTALTIGHTGPTL